MTLTNEQKRILISIFPFLQLRNVWTGKLLEHTNCIIGECLPEGWFRLFLMYCKDLLPYLEGTNTVDKFMFTDVKEKYGRICLYNMGEPEGAELLTSLYEHFSQFVCLRCGKLANYTTKGWIMPICKDCANTVSMLSHDIEPVTKQHVFKTIMYANKQRQTICISMRHIKQRYLRILDMSDAEFFEYIITR